MPVASDSQIPSVPLSPSGSPSTASSDVDPAISKFIADMDADVELAREVLAAYKAGGAGKAIAAASPLIATVGTQIADAKAAIPALKAGFKTTEGIISIAVAVGLPLLAHFTPNISPSTAATIDVASGVVGAVYALSRAFLKATQIKAAASVAASTVSVPVAVPAKGQ